MRETPKKAHLEIICDACGGTGRPSVTQPTQAGRRIYPPPCRKCDGKGRLSGARGEQRPTAKA